MTGWLRWKTNVGRNVQNNVPSALSASILAKGSNDGAGTGPHDNDMDRTERAANKVVTPTMKASANQFRDSYMSDNIENGSSPESAVDEDESSDDDDDSFDERMQFTVKSIKKHQNCADQMFGFLAPNVDENVYTPNTYFCRYINWTFRAGFFMVFLTFLVIFMLLTISFGGFLEIAGKRHPECIVVAGEPFGTNPNTTLADAYGLSWTTVSCMVE